MQTIWKFPFKIERQITIEMPRGAKVLSIQVQDGVPCMWATVDSDSGMVPQKFNLYGTGSKLPTYWGKSMRYVDTFQHGEFVWHVFEEI